MREGLDLMSFFNSDNKDYKFILNKNFIVTNKITERTIKIAESFGLGIDEERIFTVIDNFIIGFNQGEIIYITGDSGSGKSILLKLIMKNIHESKYIFEDDIVIDSEEVLIDSIGKDLKESVKILSLVGLNDAFLFLRKYKELSDGQKLRYKLAKMINTNKDIFIFDEFCATLDRETAKIVSYNIQKYCRKNNKTLIVATTHIDIKEDLSPNLYIYKKFSDDYIQEFNENNKINQCSIIKEIKYEETKDINKVRHLEKFHYRQDISTYKRIILLKMKNKIIGFMIISYPLLQLKGRNIALEKKFNISSTKNCELLNKEIECISRVVIHPKYRAIGLAHRMINHYLNNMTKARYVETVAVMAKYNPFFEKAGMKLIKTNNVDQRYNDIIKRISELGFDINLIKSLNYVKSIYEKLIYEDKQEFNKICKELYKRFSGLFSNEFKYQENDKLFENSKFLSIFHRMLKSDIQYLIFDNSDKYNLEQNKKIDLNNIFKKEEDRLENLENVRKGENNEKHRTDSIR